MTTLLTLAADPTRARVRVAVTGAAGGTLERTGPDGVNVPVRSGHAVTGDRLVDDYEAPFGVDLTYRIDGAVATVRLDVDTPWLTHPTAPDRNLAAAVVDDDDWTWAAPGTVHDPVTGADPVVVWTTRNRHEGTLVLASSWDDRHRVEAILADGSPLLLRAPAGCYVDDAWIWPEQARRRKSRAFDPSHVRWELTYRRVAEPGGVITLDPGNAWVGVPVSHPSWSELATVHADWVDVALTGHPHPTAPTGRVAP